MTIQLTQSSLKVLIVTLAVFGLAFLTTDHAIAQISETSIIPARAYVVDQQQAVVKSGFGLCWRTGYWTPAAAASDPAGCECDQELLPKEVCQPTGTGKASAVAAPAPAFPKPAAEKVSRAADVLFDFGKTDLTPQSKNMLQELAKKINTVNLEVILAIGHTDRLEARQKSLKNLGEKRASIVKYFLVMSGVDKSRIYVESKESTQPITGNKCGKFKLQKARDCLHPDRRVDIEVIATRKTQSESSNKGECRGKCQMQNAACYKVSEGKRRLCDKSAATKRACASLFGDDVADCSKQNIDCTIACN